MWYSIYRKRGSNLSVTTNQYKPVSAIIQTDDKDLHNVADHKDLVTKGIKNICSIRGWSTLDLKRYNYTKSKIRVYDKKKIEQENKERYEAIKEAKYSSGEWKRPKIN